MKNVVLMMIPALICGMLFIGCKAEKVEKTDSVFVTGDDIISFDEYSGEIVFTKAKVNEILSHIDHYPELQLFIANKPVFNPPLPVSYFEGDRFCCSPCPWAGMNDLGLVVFNSSDFLLIEGYLPWHFLSDNENDRDAILKNQEENSKKRKKELEVLIAYLSKAGKIVE